MAGRISESKARQWRRKQLPPIYLFVSPISVFTFWSFAPDGQIPISNNLSHYLGLPVRLSLRFSEISWDTSIYQRLRDYQVARGFDPTTTNFAQHAGYHLYDIVEEPLPSHFGKIEGYSALCSSYLNLSHRVHASVLLETTEKFRYPTNFSYLTPGARTSKNLHQVDLEDMSVRLIFGDTPLEGFSAGDASGNSDRLAQKATPSKTLASGSKPTPSPIIPRPIHLSSSTCAKVMTVANRTKVLMRNVVPPPRNSFNNGTTAVPPEEARVYEVEDVLRCVKFNATLPLNSHEARIFPS
ncbi:hypothetical protein V5O48_000790 [Marasmius crinis-equi]|uniref:Uncharacterized protein n=1 Tax=Marasmius crinis-equi TaxID=585013 RepID=A0ABR3G089_9AGAR